MADLLALDSTYMMLPLDESPFAINANTRAITAPRIVSLQNDQIAETAIFTIDRYFDYMDLRNAEIYVQWTLPSGKEGATKVELIDTDFLPEKIRFGWPLDSEVTSEVGQVKYSVRFWNKGMIDGEDKVVYSLNTLTSSLTISPSLQPEINPDLQLNAPITENLFKRAIRNSLVTGQGTPVPLAPVFSDPGLNLPLYASLANNTLTLKAQAVVSDTGVLSYEWFYKPAESETVDGKEFTAGAFYPYEDVTDEIGTINGFKAYGGTVDHNVFDKIEYEAGADLVIGEQYYVKTAETPHSYAAYTDTKAPSDGTELYQRFTTYTVPATNKVTGEYYVHAINTIGANSTKPQASQTCRLVSPDDVVYEANLAGVTIIPAEGSTHLTVKVNKQASADADVSYAWVKDVTSSDMTAATEVATTDNGNVEITTPGWYRVTTSALLNRETKSAVSEISKVTFDPVIPAMTYTSTLLDKMEADGTDIPNLPSDDDVELEVLMSPVVPEGYDGYAPELFSEKMDYIWKVRVPDGPEKVLGESDVGGLVVSGLGTNKLVVSATGTTAHIYTCQVVNTLNGKVTSSDDETSLSFLVI